MSTPGNSKAGRENRLARESSPYLLQHARNPVEWWGWGEEAFAEARRRDVPIFLSIGYSTCYWCHVMERESFENEAIAAQLNGACVCIKVDREERPDVDEAYMAALIITTGHGGWPMSLFLEPGSLRPFLCATYLPASPMRGIPGRGSFPGVIEAVGRAWRDRRNEVLRAAAEIARAVSDQMETRAGAAPLGRGQVGDALSTLLRMHDRAQGGFGVAPKFPQPVFLEFLLDARACIDETAREGVDAALRLTLDRMAVGGIFDQLGGGFHRYSVDAAWTVPHFEKMLYDQAQLALVYGRASRELGDAFYAEVARRTLEHVLGDLSLPGAGGFASALDAEVDAREGRSYLWTDDQVRSACGEEGEFARRVFGLDGGANFQDPHHPDEAAASVLRLRDRPDRLAAEFSMTPGALAARLEAVRSRLLAARSVRAQPSRDDKAITAWNAMAIRALGVGAEVLGEARYDAAAVRAGDFLLGHLVGAGGELARSWRGGRRGPSGVLEDYAHAIAGLAALARRGHARFLEPAERLAAKARERFAGMDGRWYDAGEGALFVRPSVTHDGATPSPGAAMMHALIDLAEASGDRAHLASAAALLSSRSSAVAESPVGCIEGTRALLRLLLSGAVAEGTGDAGHPGEGGEFTPVEVYASGDRVVLGADEPARLSLVVRIAPGHHIVAGEPGEAGARLQPLRVGVAGGEGVSVYADYPAGEALGVPGGEGVLVHRDRVEFDVVLERTGPITGRPMIVVSFQACTETECLRPGRVELDVAIDAGG